MIRILKLLFTGWSSAITKEKPSPTSEPLVVIGPGGDFTTTYYGVEHVKQRK